MSTRLLTFRRGLVVLTILVPVASVAAARPGWVADAGLDVWNVSALEQQIADATEEHQRMAAEDDAVLNRIEAKEALMAELIGGRATLAETVDQFLAMNPDPARAWLREYYDGDTDEERSARNVIEYAERRVDDPSAREALSCRLAAEFTDMLRDH